MGATLESPQLFLFAAPAAASSSLPPDPEPPEEPPARELDDVALRPPIPAPVPSPDPVTQAPAVTDATPGVVVDFWGNVEDVFVTALARYGVWPSTIWSFNPLDPTHRELKAELNDAATRDGVLHSATANSVYDLTASAFSPSLATAILNVFGPPANTGVVYDPFGGGGTRAVMAAKRGHAYVGMEIRQDQVDHVLSTARRLGVLQQVGLECGDARTPPFATASADFCYTCPPYYDLEQYKGGPADLSMCATYEEFLDGLRTVIAETWRILKPGATTCWVVGLHRDKTSLLPLHADITALHRTQGFVFREEVILTQNPHPGMQRIGNFERGAHRLIRVHEYLLVYTRP